MTHSMKESVFTCPGTFIHASIGIYENKRYYRFNSSIKSMDRAEKKGLNFNGFLFKLGSAIFSN